MKKKWSAGKIAAVICGSIAAAGILIVTFYISAFQLAGKILRAEAGNERHQQIYGAEGSGYGYDSPDENSSRGKEHEAADAPAPYDDKEQEKDKKSNSLEYYEFHDEIREDLSYQVEFEVCDEEYGENGTIMLHTFYPVCYSEAEDLKSVNSMIQKELEVLHSYAESVSRWLGEGEVFSFETESYVTYMDEEILSIAYVEYGYLNGEYYESYIVSVNIDMESKMPFTNSQLLEIDDDFSIEFRNRCEVQNGEIESLYYYSDQDITEMLNSEDDLILFYTPLGMEVGFNFDYGWVTVTYPDYQKYQKRF